MHDCFSQKGGFPVRDDIIISAKASSLVGQLVALPTNVCLDPPYGQAFAAVTSYLTIYK